MARNSPPSVEKRPYMVVRPYQDKPDYRATFESAQNRILADLKNFKETFQGLQAEDALLAIEALEQQAKNLPNSGGVVSGVFDPYSGMKYHAEIVKRKEMS